MAQTPVMARLSESRQFSEIGLNAFEDLPNLSPKQAGAVRELIQQTTNSEFLETINGITGVVDSGASTFSTFDKSDFVDGTHESVDGETIMKGIAGGLTIKGRGTVRYEVIDHHGSH